MGYIESGRRGCRPPVFAWREGVASPAGKPGKPPREASNNLLHRSVTFAGHFARITNILSVIYAPSWSASIRLDRADVGLNGGRTAGGSAGGAAHCPPCVESVITGGRHPRRLDSMETGYVMNARRVSPTPCEPGHVGPPCCPPGQKSGMWSH